MRVRAHVLALLAILVIAFAIRIAIAYAMPNQLWPDEVFQSLEQAHRIVFGRAVVPWEFVEGTRSWLFPGALAGVIGLASVFSSSAIVYVMACAVVLSVISLGPVWVAFDSARELAGTRGAIIAASTCALWYELVYFAPKAFAEVVAGNLLVIGVFVADKLARKVTSGRRHVLACACLLTFAAVLRVQLAPAAVVCFFYAFAKLDRRSRIEMFAAGAAIVVAAGVLDAVTWGTPFHSYIANFRTNIVEGRSHHFGMAPWYAYFAAQWRLWGPLGLGVLALAAVGATRARLAAVAALIVVLVHLPIAHKEYRFLYPALALVIVLAGIGLAMLVDRVARLRGARTANLAAAGAIVVVLAISLKLANQYDDPGDAFGFGVAKHTLSLWSERRGPLMSTRLLGEDPHVCGVGLVGIHWSQTGGYTYLHRDIPLLEIRSQQELAELAPYVNALIVRPGLPAELDSYTRGECWATACIYRRSGDCAPLPASRDASRAGADN